MSETKKATKKTVKKVTTGSNGSAPVKKAVKKAVKPKDSGRPIIYPEVAVTIYSPNHKAGVMRGDVAKQLLGWETETELTKFGEEYDLRDVKGNKVRLTNNIGNRPLQPAGYKTWQSEVLHDRWELNGETMIIDKTGVTIDCQHRLIGLALASEEYEAHSEEWPNLTPHTGPCMSCIVVVGIEGSDRVINTINTGIPRSLSDVIFRDNKYFTKLTTGERKKIAKITEHAIKMLAHRTAAFYDAFAPNRTHTESIDFLSRHPKLLHCVEHVWGCEDDEGSLSNVLPLGAAAALMFLMATSGQPENSYVSYRLSEEGSNEKMLTFGLMEQAEDFFEKVGTQDKKFFSIKEVYADIAKDTDSISRNERLAVVVKAWQLYAADQPITCQSLALEYTDSDDGKHLSETPTLSPIDYGSPMNKKEAQEEEPAAETEEAKAAPKRSANKKSGTIKIGDLIWVVENPAEASWQGELVGLGTEKASVKVCKGYAGAGKNQTVHVKQLSLTQPKGAANAPE